MRSRRTRRQLLRHLVPFLGAALVAFALTAATASIDWPEYAAALAGTLAVVAMAAVLPWRRLPSAARVLPTVVFLVSAALLRDSAGGVTSGVGILALLPVFWVALHGTRGELAVVLVAVAAYYVGPIALIGGVDYPASGYRGAVLFLIVSGIVGLTVQGLVARVRAHADELAARESAVATVAAVARRLPTSPDARMEICRAALEIGGAQFAILLEPSGEALASTAMVGVAAAPVSLPLDREGSASVSAFRSQQSVYAADAAASDLVSEELWRAHGRPASMLFEPVLHGDAAVGVLAIGWDERPTTTRGLPLVKLLAAEAAVAIERADLLRRLGELALTDALTGLPNRRALDTSLTHALGDAAATGRPLCVALLDLDHFKAYNDARGHQTGDRLLKGAAAAWRAELRPGDLLARYGGEEFAVVLPDCDRTSALAVLERLRGATPEEQTCSAGLARWDGAESLDELVGRADEALYRAKDAGRDRTAV